MVVARRAKGQTICAERDLRSAEIDDAADRLVAAVRNVGKSCPIHIDVGAAGDGAACAHRQGSLRRVAPVQVLAPVNVTVPGPIWMRVPNPRSPVEGQGVRFR